MVTKAAIQSWGCAEQTSNQNCVYSYSDIIRRSRASCQYKKKTLFITSGHGQNDVNREQRSAEEATQKRWSEDERFLPVEVENSQHLSDHCWKSH